MWQKVTQAPLNDATQPVDSEEKGRSYGQTMAEEKPKR